MGGKNEIGAKIVLGGEKQFKTAISDINKSLTMMSSELKKTEETCKGNANSLEALSAKQEILTKMLQEQQKKVNASQEALSKAQKEYDKVGESLTDLYVDFEKATDQLQELEQIYGESSEEVAKQRKEVEKLQTAIAKGEQNYRSAGNEVKDWETKLNKAQTEVIKTNRALSQNEKYLDEAKGSVDGCARSIDKYGKQIKESGSKTKSATNGIEDLADEIESAADAMDDGAESASMFGEMLSANLASAAIETGVGAIKDGISSAIEGILEYDAAAQQLQASIGASAAEMEKYRSVIEDINKDAYGESFDDIADAVSTVKRNMGELNEADLKNVSENCIALRDTFGYEYQESINTVKALMKNFGVTSDEAFNLLVQGAQSGIDQNGNMLDVLNEYGPKFADMGFGAEEMFNALANGVKSGIFDVDKLGDAINEFSIRVKDGTADNAFKNLGLDADEMKRKFGEGGTSAQEAFQTVVKALNSTEDPLAQNKAGVELFGTMWEDTGGKAILALQNTQGEISASKSAMQELNDVKYDDIGSRIAALGRQIKGEVQDRLENLLPIASNGLEFIAENFDGVETATIGLGTAILANAFFKSETFSTISGAIGTITTKITGAGGLKAALVALASNNPFFAISLAIGGVVAGIKLLVDNIELPVNKTQELVEKANTLNEESDQLLEKVEQSRELWETNNQGIEDQEAYANDLATELMNLVDKTERSISENARLKQIMSELNTLYPNLALTIDDQTGSLKLNGEEYGNVEEAIRAVISASSDYAKIEENEKRINDIRAERSDLEKKLADARAQEAEQAEYLKGLEKERADLSKITGETQEEIIAKSYDEAQNIELEKVNDEISKTNDSLEETRATCEELENGIKALDDEEKGLAETNKAMAQSTEETAEQMDGAGESAVNMAQMAAGAADTMKLSTEVSVKAQKEALESLQGKYNEMRSSIEEDLKNKINPYEIFEVESENSEDWLTTEKMTANMQENIQTLEEYQANLERARRAVDEGIIDPEYYKHLLDMGLDGAATLRHITHTLDDLGDAEGVRELSDTYMEMQSTLDGTSDLIASEQAVWSGFLETIGSAPEEFDELQKSFEDATTALSEAGTPASESVKMMFQEMLNTARESGIAIPEGLAEGLASGEISIEDAAATLQGAMQGTFDFLAQMAQEQGIAIPEELAAAIKSGGPEMADAINTLIKMISEGSIYNKLRKAMSSAAEAVGDSSEEFSQEAQNAFLAIVETAEKYGIKIDESLINGISSGSTALTDATDIIQETVTSGLDTLIADAEALGVKFPEGLKAGVEEGSGYTAEAMAMIDESIQEKTNDLTAKMKEMGIEIPAELQAGIDAGGSAAIDAIEKLNALIEEKQSETTETAEKIGKDNGDAQAKGTQEKEGVVSEAGKNLANSGVSGAASTRTSWQQEGSTLGQMLASGISNSGATVNAAGGGAAYAGINSARAQYNGYYDAGNYLARGLAEGIRSGGYLVERAADDIARRGVDVAKSILSSGSRSLGQDTMEAVSAELNKINGRIEEIVEQANKATIPGRFTRQAKAQMEKNFGVSRLDKNGVKKSTEQYYKEIYGAAAKWLSEYKKQHGLTLTEETKFWSLMMGEVEKGTQAYYQVQANLSSARFRKDIKNPLSNNFGVKKTDEDGKAKPADDYYNEMISAAKNWLDNYKITHDVSLQYEEYYWTQVQKKVAKGSDAWYDAQKKITQLQKEKQKELLSASQTALDQYKTYYKVSEYAEVQYWHIVRQQFKEGTEERIEADKKYFEAKQAYNDKLIELNEKYVKSSDEIKAKVKEQAAEMRQAYEDTVNERAESIYNSFGLFDEFYSESDHGDVLLNNLRNQVAGYADWELQLEKLKNKGVSEELLEKLQAMGPEASASLHALNELTAAQLQEYQELWQKKHDLAMSQSQKENEGLREETEKEIEQMVEESKEEILKLREEYLKAVAEVQEKIEQPLKNIAANTKKIGEDITAQLIAGITSGATKNDMTVQLEKSAGSVTEALKEIPEETKTIGEEALENLLEELINQAKIEEFTKKAVEQVSAAVKTEIERDAFLQTVLENTTAKVASVSEMESRMNQISVSTNSRMAETNDTNRALSQICDLLQAYIPYLAQRQQIIFDVDDAVNALQPGISHVTATNTRRKR